MKKKHIEILEVENGLVVTYTVIGSGQEQKTVHTKKAEVREQIAYLLDRLIEDEGE